MMEEVSRVREFGVKKHGSVDGWKTTTPLEHYDAAERHIRKLMDGEWMDLESGLSHAAHAICDLMFEIERMDSKDIPFISESAIINPEIWNKFKEKIKKGVLRKTKNEDIIKGIDKILKKEEKK